MEEYEKYYEWYTNKVIKSKACYFTTLSIEQDTEDSEIIAKGCKVKDLTYELERSKYIWETKTIHKCPYQKLYSKPFIFNNTKENIMENRKDEIAFELTEASTICGNITVYSTFTGLYAKRPEDKPSTCEIETGITDKSTELQGAEAQIDYRHMQNAYIQSLNLTN
jgi:hypothetical protein